MTRPCITADAIIAAACHAHGISKDVLLVKSNAWQFSHPRQRVAWMMDELRPDLSWQYIARRLGHREHSNVYHGIKKTVERVNDPHLGAKEVALLNAMAEHVGLPPFFPADVPVLLIRQPKSGYISKRIKVREAVKRIESISLNARSLLTALEACLPPPALKEGATDVRSA